MKPNLRKFVLTAHIAFSVGWLGAVAAFLNLAVAGLSQNPLTARSAYLAMDLIGWYVIVPAGLATLLIGVFQSLGTKWGLIRHYWVLIKFILTLGATALLILHMRAASGIAAYAARSDLSDLDIRPVRIRLVADAGAALLVLLIATILSVYKPWGLTAYGRRARQSKGQMPPTTEQKTGAPWGLYVLIGLGCLALLFIVRHLAGGGFGPPGH